MYTMEGVVPGLAGAILGVYAAAGLGLVGGALFGVVLGGTAVAGIAAMVARVGFAGAGPEPAGPTRRAVVSVLLGAFLGGLVCVAGFFWLLMLLGE